jgi:hypothetical protein
MLLYYHRGRGMTIIQERYATFIKFICHWSPSYLSLSLAFLNCSPLNPGSYSRFRSLDHLFDPDIWRNLPKHLFNNAYSPFSFSTASVSICDHVFTYSVT